MNKVDTCRILFNQAIKEVQELEDIVINFSSEIENQNKVINRAIEFVNDNIDDVMKKQMLMGILRGEK